MCVGFHNAVEAFLCTLGLDKVVGILLDQMFDFSLTAILFDLDCQIPMADFDRWLSILDNSVLGTLAECANKTGVIVFAYFAADLGRVVVCRPSRCDANAARIICQVLVERDDLVAALIPATPFPSLPAIPESWTVITFAFTKTVGQEGVSSEKRLVVIDDVDKQLVIPDLQDLISAAYDHEVMSIKRLDEDIMKPESIRSLLKKDKNFVNVSCVNIISV